MGERKGNKREKEGLIVAKRKGLIVEGDGEVDTRGRGPDPTRRRRCPGVTPLGAETSLYKCH